jgi:S-DNA-T family DNA segregation ATPase FtsK/SpoIIIE
MSDVKFATNFNEQEAYERAVGVMITHQKVSTSYIQRKLGISYNKARILVERAEKAGIVAPPNYVGKREILLVVPASI